ncbi:MAG: serine hydrolase domain-containing protein [Bacteroidota bacterium]
MSGLEPGLAVGIVRNGEVIFENYLGYANLQHQTLVTDSTRFNIASTAKQFTALCILQLSLEEKLNLDDDIRKYLPAFYTNIQEPIKIKHLLSHSSGIRDFYDLISLQKKTWWKQEGLSNKDALKLIGKQRELNFKPGTKYDYSNSNYTILTAIVKEVSGKSFHEYSKSLFSQLGMNETSFMKNYMSVIPNIALPYSKWGSWKQYPMMTNLYGDGFLFTTLKDQLKYEGALQTTNTNKLLTISQKAIPGTYIDEYGFGLELNKKLGRTSVSHSGSTGAYHSQLFRFPEDRLSIMVMSNNGTLSSGSIANSIASFLLEDKAENSDEYFAQAIKATSSQISQDNMVGEYANPENEIIRILEKEGSLYWKTGNNNAIKLNKESSNLYSWESNTEMKLGFELNDEHGNIFNVYYPGSEPRVHKKLPLFTPDLTYLKALQGDYVSDELNIGFNLKLNNQQELLLTRHEDGDGNPVEIIQRDHILLSNYRMAVERDTFDQVSDIFISYGQLINMRFTKEETGTFQPEIPTKMGSIQVTTIGAYPDGSSDILLTKNYPNGNEEWAKRFGGKSYDRASSIISTSDGGYLIIGSTSSYGKGNYDIWLIKTDKKGKELWNRAYGGLYNEYGYFAMQKEDGSFLIKGDQQACPSVNSTKCSTTEWIFSVDSHGNALQELN